MSGPFIFIARNTVRDGKFDAEQQRVPGWIDYIASHEPRLLAFHEFANEDGTAVEYVQVHPDTDSFEHHLNVLEQSGRTYTKTLQGTTSIRIYGTPTPVIMEMLTQATGNGVQVTIHPEHLGGFTRP